MPWYIYILECSDHSLYTGITTDIDRRLKEHNSGTSKAARYTRSRTPVVLRYQESTSDRAAACQREIAIKSLTRAEKIQLIESRSSSV